MPEARAARCITIGPMSIAWAITRMVNEAVDEDRLSETEAALIRDLISHTAFPPEFLIAPHEGGHERQERF